MQKVRPLLPFEVHSLRRSSGDQWCPQVEDKRRDVFRVLGKDRNGLLRVHEGMPVESSEDAASPLDNRADCEEPSRTAHLLIHGRSLLRQEAQARIPSEMG